jgi:hypothetical protein
MKIQLIFATLILCLLTGCSGKDDESSPTATSAPTFATSDLQGSWKGTAVNSSNSLTLSLAVDGQCKATGSGVSSTWSIDNTGKVTGGGSFSFVSGSYLTVASSSWSLQMSQDKKSLSGSMDVSYPTLHNMTVSLTKQ